MPNPIMYLFSTYDFQDGGSKTSPMEGIVYQNPNFFVGVLRHADDNSAIGFSNFHKLSALPCRVGTQKIVEK